MKLLCIIFEFICNPISMVFAYFLRASRLSPIHANDVMDIIATIIVLLKIISL